MSQTKKKDEIFVFVHGFVGRKSQMNFLEKGIKQLGYNTISVKIPAIFGTFTECLISLDNQIKNIISKYKKINYIAHSMGGLLVREYINYKKQINVNRVIFIATPHKGTKLANILHSTIITPKIFPILTDLLDKKELTLIDRNIKIGVIAGNKTHTFGYLLKNTNDGRVEVNSVKCKDSNDFIILPYTHEGILKKQKTLEKIINFINYGKF